MVKNSKTSQNNPGVSFNPILLKLFLIWLIAICFGLIFALINIRINRSITTAKKTNQLFNPNKVKIIDQVKRTGYFKLSTVGDQKIFLQKKPITITLTGDSDKKLVTGYDVVLTYDDDVLTFDKVQNLIDGLDLRLTDDTPGNLVFTAVRKTDYNGNLVFNNENLVNLVFIPKAIGEFGLKFQFTLGETNDTNLVSLTVNADDLLGSAEDFNGYVGSLVKITGDIKTIDQDLLAAVKIIKVPAANCNDCMTYLTIELERDNQKQDLEFFSGGFDGKPFQLRSEFGYVFEINDFNQSEIFVRMAK